MNLNELIANPDSIKDLITGMGFCFVSKKVTSGECPVGFMYREKPGEEEDSGWRFMSGTETDEYLDDEDNMRLVDVNIVANIDPAIIPYLRNKPGAELERDHDSGTFSVC